MSFYFNNDNLPAELVISCNIVGKIGKKLLNLEQEHA